MRFRISFITALLVALVLCGCSGKDTKTDKVPLVKVGDEVIYVDELLKNPSFKGMVDQIIKQKIIEQEYAVRGFKLTDERFKEEWDTIVKSQAQGDEKAFRTQLEQQGLTDEFVKEQINTNIMYTDLVLSEYPITIDDAKADFETNKTRYQRMFANQVPTKTKWEEITFEDVQTQVMDLLKKKKLQEQGRELLDQLHATYQEKGWIKNLLTPDDPNALTIIKPKPTDEMQEMKPETLDQKALTPDKPKEEKVEEGKDAKSGEEAKPSEGDGKDDSSNSEDKKDDKEKQPDKSGETGSK
jgi:hypothetical protein